MCVSSGRKRKAREQRATHASTVRVVHTTSVHAWNDVRIFSKECVTLAKYGYDVTLIAPRDGNSEIRGVKIIGVRSHRNRLARLVLGGIEVLFRALQARADIYHFHDPELLPIGLILRLLRKKVVYDVHEDYATGIAEKRYLPVPVRHALASFVAWLERIIQPLVETVLAERYYRERFPEGVLVLNYPQRSTGLAATHSGEGVQKNRVPNRVLYTGGISISRGALVHANLVNLREDLDVVMIGRCPRSVYEQIQAVAGENRDRVFVEGVDHYVSHERIVAAYDEYSWLAGLALFPYSPHYARKELTKFFEYMQAGIPILASAFPTWTELIEKTGCGITVDPGDPEAVRQALQWLLEHPDEVREMGEKGKWQVQHTYHWDSQASNLLRLYERLRASM